MAAANSTFAERLNEAFEHRGITDHQERINRLSAATGRTAHTVARWLSGETVPRGSTVDKDVRLRIAFDVLHVDARWLIRGEGYSPWQIDMIEKLRKIPPEYLPKLTRYLLRLKNKDPKALRWSAMCERGELNGWQVLDMA